MKKEIPVEKNKVYSFPIHGLGHRGEGIGKIDGFTIFVEEAIPGDEVQAKVIKTKSNYAIGKLEMILNPSKDRIDPRCLIADQCGGCQIQQIEYQRQLEYKTQLVRDNLERIGKIKDVIIHPTIGMKDPWRYRNKAQFPIGEEGGAVLGFYAKKSHRIIPGDSCYIQHSVNDQITKIVVDFIDEYKISIYQEEKNKGLFRHVVTKVGFTTKEIMVILVINGNRIPNSKQLIDRLTENIPSIASIYLNFNKRKTNSILGRENKLLYGKEHIVDYIGDIKFEISPLSFFQVNPMQTKVLYEKALEYANLQGRETVYDAYCGIGTISLFLAQRAKKVIGVEIVEEAIEDAKRNAELNHVKNTEFYAGKAEKLIPELYKEGKQADVVVVDPPRKGCDEKLLDTIIQMKLQRMVYVSCNPSTLARDLHYLENGGFKTVEVQPVDMFPHTMHVETVCLLTRK